MARNRPVHLIYVRYGYECRAVCDNYIHVLPIEANNKIHYKYMSKGTFNPKKVTCKRCLKHDLYKEALDKVNNPLFYWRERI